MRTPLTPDSNGRSSSARQAAGVKPGGNSSGPFVPPPSQPPKFPPAPTGSSLVSLQRAADAPLRAAASTDDAPTIITPARVAAPSDPDLALFAGGKLGQYELIDTVGTGGMAAVLRARDSELGRLVALKILPSQMARDPENVVRFKQEARAAAKLDHDNIARVFSCGEDRGLNFIAFELVEGDNLRTLIERRGPLAPAECVRYMLQVAAGLAHAADRGVVHRDIKPSNIVVTPDGRAKIVDMGLARSLGGAGGGSVNGGVTQSGVTLGTFDYISPEQAIDPRKADARSDIYSLGCAFYHALTGRPPVPDGTAAMKLNAHQHLPVLDPRVLNPGVPDELAAVLSRMMAKDPARRYQTPAALIAALAAVARGLDLTADGLPVDPAQRSADHAALRVLPAPPRVPVGLVAGVAAVAVALAVIVGLSGQGRDPVIPAGPDPVAGLKVNPASDPTAAGPPPVAAVRPAAAEATATTTAELVQLLRDGATKIRLVSGQKYDLAGAPEPAATFAGGAGKAVTIEGPVGGPQPVVRVAAVPVDPENPYADRPGALTFGRAAVVRIRGVQFDVADAPAGEPADHAVGVAVADAARLELEECRFDRDKELKTAEVVGLAVTAREAPTEVVAKNCYFGVRRGAEVQFAGRVKADVTECAFAPHPAAFKLNAPDKPTPPDAGADAAPGELKLKHCSFLLDRGAVADVADGARWAVTAGFCVFAAVPPDMAAVPAPDAADRRAVVLHCAGDRPDGAQFRGSAGQANAYYRTDPVALGARAYSFAECKQQFPTAAVDDDAVTVPQSPWAAADPARALAADDPWRAFRLKATLPFVRVSDADVVLVGVRWRARKDSLRVYDVWPPQTQETAARPGEKVWWPAPPADVRGGLPANHYETLAAAVAALKPGDTLLVRHDGRLPVPQTDLSGPKLNVTVKPYPGTVPVLEPGPDMSRIDAGLFRLSEGKLTLEDLEIRLKARAAKPGDVRSLAVVTVVAGSQCTLRHCAVTLAEDPDGEKLAAVVLTDPDTEMRTTPGRGPEVKLENCLVRGHGRAVWVQSSRPFDLDLTNTVTALTGPVLEIDPPARAPKDDATCQVRLDRLTAVLAGPLFDFQPGRTDTGAKSPGWVRVEVQSKRCVFAATDKGAPVAAVEGADAAALKATFTWQHAGRANWYVNFPPAAPFLTATPLDGPALPKTVDADGWFAFTGEKADESVGKVTFGVQVGARMVATVVPDNVAPVIVDIPGAGVEDAGAETAKVARPTTAEQVSGEK